ncbi:MAG: MBL fold metallo-hydrolase [Phycisphaerae bacterium]|nr:MBL fold metallo-hydrolase [Phycisphaerae bacterium]
MNPAASNPSSTVGVIEHRPVVTTFPLGSWQTNCHVVHVPSGSTPKDCWIVDCGESPQPLFAFIEREGLRPVGIALTHCHVDHIKGIDQALSRFGALPILAHELERDFNAEPTLNLSAFAGSGDVSVTAPTAFVADGDVVDLCGSRWTVRHVPGHSPGSVAYVHLPSKQALVGDTLFKDSIGRYDFPTSDGRALKRSVLEVLMSLPDDLEIRPGHGPASTIGRERRANPYVVRPQMW